MKKLSFFIKIFSGYFLIIIILSGVILFSSFRIINNHYLNNLTAQLKNYSILLKDELTPLLVGRQTEKINQLIRSAGKKINTRITVIDVSGKVLGDSEANYRAMENHRNRPEIINALNNKAGHSVRFSATEKQKMLYVAVPVEYHGKIIGVIRTSLFINNITHLLNQLKNKIFHITLIIILLSLIGVYFFSNTISSPLRKINAAARQIARGNFNNQIKIKNKDELGELADSFNHMARQINNLFNQLSHEKEHLNSIIYSVDEGILVIDKDSKIILANNGMKKLIHNENIISLLYWDALRNFEINNLIEQVKKKKGNINKEIGFNDRSFICSASYLSPNKEIVLIFHDITEQKNLEKIKKDFIVNVSHELRTPLTAVKGFVETISVQQKNGKLKHYLNIIKRHTDRLINIVADLLTLSKLETENEAIQIETVDLRKMLKNLKDMFAVTLKTKSIEMPVNINKNAVFIKADAFHLEKMFINLIDNALKYTDKGTIKITIKKQKNTVIIQIEDTGIGIPPEHLSRLFERFYVVDKSRSRESGGTGLGLSIVKHIVLLHNGEIMVDSAPGKGTKFTIILPQQVPKKLTQN